MGAFIVVIIKILNLRKTTSGEYIPEEKNVIANLACLIYENMIDEFVKWLPNLITNVIVSNIFNVVTTFNYL